MGTLRHRRMLLQPGPRSSSGVPPDISLSHLTLEAMARREKPIANQPIVRVQSSVPGRF